MIAAFCQPYSILQDIGFTWLMKKARQNYEMPSRKCFSERIVASIHTSLRTEVKEIVEECESMFHN